MTDRFKDDRATIETFGDEILVECPRCAGCARMTLEAGKMVCTGCGLTKKHTGEPLWLSAQCCGETLVAYNARHLDWLEAFIGAKLRERPADHAERGYANRSMASRLPQWMRSAKNRAEVLKGLAKLRKRSAQ